MPSDTPKMTARDVREQNLRSPHVGVRWQAEMEEHLESVRRLTSEALLEGIATEHVTNRCHLASAHATAAMALAIANTGSDIEQSLVALAERVGENA